MRILSLVLFLSIVTSAQTFVTQTDAAMTLYVDPTGADYGACTAAGVAACRTLGGALFKVPAHIRHAVIVNVASGTYTETFRAQGFFIESSNGTPSTASLSITGVQTPFTVATGSNTGTVSSYTSGDVAHPLLNDMTQNWTVNDLRGRFVTITAGPGINEHRLIVSNTATQLTLNISFFTPPTTSSVYAIRTPGPVFTGALPIVRGFAGSGLTTITDISFQPVTAYGLNILGVSSPVTLTRLRLVGTSHGLFQSVTAQNGTPYLTVNYSYFGAGTSSGVTLANSVNASFEGILVQCLAVPSCGNSGIRTGYGNSQIRSLTGTVQGPFIVAMIELNSPQTLGAAELYIDCTNAIPGVWARGVIKHFSSYLGSGWNGSSSSHNGCSVGFSLNSPSTSWIDGNTYFTNVTTAIELTGGARATIQASPTFTGVTNQLSIDGTVYTDADLTTFTRITGPQGSYATRP